MKLSWHASFPPSAKSKRSPIPYKKKKRSSVRKVTKCKDEYGNTIVWNVRSNIIINNLISLYIYIYIYIPKIWRCSYYFLIIKRHKLLFINSILAQYFAIVDDALARYTNLHGKRQCNLPSYKNVLRHRLQRTIRSTLINLIKSIQK